MKRFALTLAGLLTLPVLAGAQTRPVYSPEPHPQQLPHSRFSVTPFVGARIPYNTGTFYVAGSNGNTHQLEIEEEREGSPAVGLNLDVLLRGPFAFTTGLAYSGGVQDIFTYGVPGDSVAEGRIITDAPEMWFVKAGLTARLPDPIRDDRRFHPSGFITVAPAMVFAGETTLRNATRHLALNLGADATARIGRSGWAFQVGLEDYITFWNSDDFGARDAAIFGSDERFGGEPVFVDYDYRTANIFMVRFGVSYRPARGGARPLATYVAPLPPMERAAAPTPVRLCVVSGGQLTEIQATYDPERADTLVDGRPVAMAHPSDALPYAAAAPWYINNEPILVGGNRFVKYGLPRRLPAGELRPAGEFRGVPIFVEAGTTTPEVYYVPVRPGCEFQPYQNNAQTGAVRGE